MGTDVTTLSGQRPDNVQFISRHSCLKLIIDMSVYWLSASVARLVIPCLCNADARIVDTSSIYVHVQLLFTLTRRRYSRRQ